MLINSSCSLKYIQYDFKELYLDCLSNSLIIEHQKWETFFSTLSTLRKDNHRNEYLSPFQVSVSQGNNNKMHEKSSVIERQDSIINLVSVSFLASFACGLLAYFFVHMIYYGLYVVSDLCPNR